MKVRKLKALLETASEDAEVLTEDYEDIGVIEFDDSRGLVLLTLTLDDEEE